MVKRVRLFFASTLRRSGLFAERVCRAWRYYTRLDYTWRLAWAKSATGGTMDEHADIRYAGRP